LDQFQMESQYLIYIMTYCGEVIKNKVGGNWVLNVLSIEGKDVYEPVIRVRDDRDYSPLWPIVQEISDRPTSFSFKNAIEGEMEKYKLIDMMLKKNK